MTIQQQELFHRASAARTLTVAGTPDDVTFVIYDGNDLAPMFHLDHQDIGELFSALGKYLGGIEGGGAIVEMIEPVERMRIFGEIHDERQRQDEQWGGPNHDDFDRFIRHQLLAIEAHASVRKCFVNIAALAIAAVESIDRELTRVGS